MSLFRCYRGNVGFGRYRYRDTFRCRRYGPRGFRRRLHEMVAWGGDTTAMPTEPEPEQGIPEATEEDLEGVIQVVSVNLNAQQNTKSHHTNQYDQVDTGDLIVRRGQPFKIAITFNRPFDEEEDDLRLVFETGTQPLPSKGTSVRFLMSAEDKPKEWGAKIATKSGNDVILTVFTPPDCIIGEWEFSVETILTGETDFKAFKYEHPEPFYILFNPWCKDDVVYFRDEKLLNEYILNDTGAIYSGNSRQIGAMPWVFGQFEEGILEASLYCVTKAFKNQVSSMGDPVKVSRAISRFVNSSDDNGVLQGRWDGNYEGGKSPLFWKGSVKILKQYMATKKAVKYGQCFVFSGIVTTVCRALGLPCRSTTNFASAHDQDASVSIDKYWDLVGNEYTPLEYLNSDSTWNFHVWNDVWMKRLDLPVGYGGWQAIDATPQESSGGYYQCGPVPLKAILNGQCDLQYDAPFVFAEVNADIVHWVRCKNGDFEVAGYEKSAIGKNISTKFPDGKPRSKRQDITDEYKYDDESDKERISVINASRASRKSKPIYSSKEKDVKFSFIQLDNVMIGNDFEHKLIIQNTSDKVRTVEGKLISDAVSYMGHKEKGIKKQGFCVTLQPGEKQEATMKVVADEYVDQVSESAAMKVSVIASVRETQQIQTWQDDFRLRKPDLNVELVTTSPRVNEELQFKISLKNPLKSKRLTNCKLQIEGPGIQQDHEFPLGDIEVGNEWAAPLTVTPKKQGTRLMIASFECDQLNDISGTCEVDIA